MADALMDEIERLVRLLIADDATMDAIASRLGAVTGRYGDGRRLVVEPTSAVWRSARLISAAGDGVPTVVTLVPSPDHRPTVVALENRFGACKRIRGEHFDDETELIFQPPTPAASSWACILVASVPGDSVAALDSVLVSSLGLRRDRRG